ncbi:meprin A subunit beta-like [Actinia tenebrosa]|uniref:Metalloendopeptidase n=1 Tax=Actinia tenebrosa TaxID=6105 RepID=A0A6P8J5D1_ACTTE|nr:meprin A subunit beta-like [Actinia tenebrosa]
MVQQIEVDEILFEGDIVLDEKNRDVDEPQEQKRNARRDRSKIWKTKVVPYVIDQSLRSPTDAGPHIQQAIAEFHKHTCVKFVPRKNEKNWIKFVKKSGCYSSVGKIYWKRGGQDVSIGQGCARKGIIMHELLHALGFWHEQSRPDRDQYVKVLWENIARGKKHNFDKYGHGKIDRLKAAYDLGSIMHYGKYEFSRNGKPTIESISNPNQQLGQRNGFSQTDIFEVNALYDCSGPSNGWSSWSDYGPCVRIRRCTKIRQRFCSSSDVSNCPGANAKGLEKETAQCSPSECNAVLKDDCNFDQDMCGWKARSRTNTLSWTRRSGSTPSSNTGPNSDHTSGLGSYVYVEASSSTTKGQTATLVSKVFPPAPSGRCMSFFYHMYGATMGSLNVYIKSSSSPVLSRVFKISGDQKNKWHQALINISNMFYTYKVVFESVRGSSYLSDIALDDITFTKGPCPKR